MAGGGEGSSAGLEICGVRKAFPDPKRPDGRLNVLDGIDLAVPAGRFFALVGPSGSGKSTLLDIVAGLVRPDAGTVHFSGAPIDGRPGTAAYMMQDDLLFPWQTIREHVALPLIVRGVRRREALRQAEALLRDFGLGAFVDRYPSALSGGMRQRAALARTLVQGTALVLLDEPFGRLDALTRASLQEWLEGVYRRERRTILMVTHDVEEALYLADRIVVFSPRPARVVDVVEVPFDRPRTRSLRADGAFVRLKAALLERLLALLPEPGDRPASAPFR
ncbi:MAG: ABC transporter ATP-binding protein [Brockia lithotrophica]|nr:ABC transporter ATP-binding protein [Brockia lithotrophica]